MGNKSSNKQNVNNNSLRLTTPHMGGITKKVHEAKTSRVGRKARDIVKKNLAAFFTKSINPLMKHNTTNNFLLPSSTAPNSVVSAAVYKLPSNDQEDASTHQFIFDSLSQEYALHASPSWQYVASTVGEPRFPHIDGLPRNWKESLKSNQYDLYGFTAKLVKFQELIYEIILTEQSYVDDLILVYKIFIKEALQWDGLPAAVKHLFENIFQIIRLHLQMLKELRARQVAQHPVVRSITDICRSFISRFEIYAAYFSNFEKANHIIMESIKSQDELGSFISRRSLWAECRNLPLSAYLLTPIQRVMRYPLFFKSLAECLLENDGDAKNIHTFLQEMDVILRYFEKQKKESEDFIKLEDLARRIKGLEGSTIRIAEHGRRLIHEGYLTIIPESDKVFSSSRLDESSVSFSSSLYPPPLSRRNSTFSLSSSRRQQQKRMYVFLFNDMIVCTRERDKKRSSPTENKAIMGPPPRKGSFYGPSPDTLFKITHTPGRITLVDRAVTREVFNNHDNRPSRRGSALFQSLKRYSSRTNEEEGDSHNTSSPVCETPQTSYFTLQSCNDIYNSHHNQRQSHYHQQQQQQKQQEQKNAVIERHPTQFVCSIATKNLTNIQFEAETPEEKDIWCHYMESVLSEHVQRNISSTTTTTQHGEGGGGGGGISSTHNKRISLSPTHSTYSFESVSSTESSAAFSSAWTGYCDVERMDIDDGEQQQLAAAAPFSIGGEAGNSIRTTEDGGHTVSNNNNIPLPLNKSQEFLQTIMGEFGDNIWQMDAPPGLSSYQLRHTFSNVGSQL